MTANAGPVDLGSLFAVFAHPDDEAYLAGGLMAIAADAGRRVVCVTATRGELGFPDDDTRTIDERKAVRTEEMGASLEILGVEEHHWLDYPDSGCASVPIADGADRLRELIDDVHPDTVLTFGPDGGTFHDDHIAVGHWSTVACRTSSWSPRLLYNANTPEWIRRWERAVAIDGVMMADDVPPVTTPIDELAVHLVADDALADRKARALLAQRTQVEPIIEEAGYEAFLELIREEHYRTPTPADWPA